MNICIFCKSSTNSFNSVEHIFPESLGNNEKILHKGVVCDVCNNQILSGLDSVLLDFEPIKFFRVLYGIKSKKGNIPSANFNGLCLDNNGNGTVHIRAQGKKSITDQSTSGFNLNFKGNKRMNDTNLKLLARSLYKIGFELVCLDHGVKYILSNRFDEAREIILGSKDFNGYLLIGTSKQSLKPGVTYRFLKDEKNREFIVFEFKYFFVHIIYDMERRMSLLDNGVKLQDYTLLKF